MTQNCNAKRSRPGPRQLAEYQQRRRMSQDRGVNDMQEKDTPAQEPQGAADQNDGAAQPAEAPFKPVIAPGAAKRANASVIGMIIALAISIAAFVPIILMNPQPKSEGYRADVDVAAVSRNAADVAGFTPAAPVTDGAFRPNYARWEAGTASGVPTWEVGYLTPKNSFIALVQTIKSNPTWLLQQTKNAPVTGSRSEGGQEWQLRDTGKGEKSLVLEYRGTTIILSGAAALDEFGTLAAAVVQSMDSSPAVTNSASAPAAP